MSGIDLQADMRESKKAEQVLGWVGFRGKFASDALFEGVLKLSAHYRTDQSGYLTLTFLLDDPAPTGDLGPLVRLPKEDQLRERLGAAFEMAVNLRLDSTAMAISEGPKLAEVNLYFRWLERPALSFINERVLPSLSDWLNLEFDPIETFEAPNGSAPESPARLSWIRRLLGF